MPDALVFHDLVGSDREPTREEDAWLAVIAGETDPSNHTVKLAASVTASDPGPVLQRQLDGTWRAGRYIGELRLDGRTLEIRPRLDIAVIAAWASAALNVRIVPRAAEHRRTSALIAELLAATWRSAVVAAARHGLPGLRVRRQQVGPHARGRLDVPATLRMRAARRPLLATINRPKIIDNPVTRSIVLADRVLDRRLRRPDWRGDRVEELMPRLRAAVGSRPPLPSRHELDRVRYTPITLAYRRAAEMSWQIAQRRGLRASATSEQSEGLLIDIAELWELFLVHCAKRAFGSSAVTHGTRLVDGRPLLRSANPEGGTLGRLYPDIVVGNVDWPRAIIDAKYKPLADPRGVDREDLYQLTSYLAGHQAKPPPLGMLAYTQFPGQATRAYAEARTPWTTLQGHQVRFERLPVTEADCVSRLRALVP